LTSQPSIPIRQAGLSATGHGRYLRPIALFVVLAVWWSTAGSAQLMLTPIAGAYVPTGNVYEQPGSIGTARQGTSFAFGGRLMFSTSGRLGIEVGATYAPSKVEIVTISTVSRSAHLWLGQLRLVYVLNSEWAPINIYAAGGAAVVSRGGEAYEGVTGLTDLAGNLAFGALFRVSSSYRIRLEVEDYLYTTQMTFPSGETSGSRFQNDFVFTFGLSIPIG
jgi:hypothetical protein